MRISGTLILLAGVAVFSGCRTTDPAPGVLTTGGNPRRGAAAISRYGCGSCHTVAGIGSARGLVGPPLTGIRSRIYIAGILTNQPDNLIQWIRDPKSVNPKTAMPSMGVSENDAADIAAYLYSK